MYLRKGMPKQGELVICKAKKILPHSAIMELVEYENVEAFLHVSQISDSWVKSINDYVSKDSEIPCRVIRINDKGIEVSMKQVSKESATAKLNELRAERKAVNIVQAVAKKIGKSEAVLEKELVSPVMREYASINAFIELLKQEGDKILKEVGVPEYWKQPILDYASKNVKTVQIKTEIELYTLEPNGIELVRKDLENLEKNGIEIRYISAPKYLLSITSKNYKDAQKSLDAALEAASKELSKQKVVLNYSKK